MSVNTNNIYGEISISDQAIAKFDSHVAMECYGIVEIVSCGFFAQRGCGSFEGIHQV